MDNQVSNHLDMMTKWGLLLFLVNLFKCEQIQLLLEEQPGEKAECRANLTGKGLSLSNEEDLKQYS